MHCTTFSTNMYIHFMVAICGAVRINVVVFMGVLFALYIFYIYLCLLFCKSTNRQMSILSLAINTFDQFCCCCNNIYLFMQRQTFCLESRGNNCVYANENNIVAHFLKFFVLILCAELCWILLNVLSISWIQLKFYYKASSVLSKSYMPRIVLNKRWMNKHIIFYKFLGFYACIVV